jgi:YidC/Oxa1 family membrane protein insertase
MFAAISNIFGYLLNFLYELVNSNFGFAIILFSILLRIILLPVTIKQQKSMQKTNKIQGELKSLQFKYKNNPEMLNKETMELYKREKISPFSGCLSAIVQIIIILSVFYLVSQPLTYMKKANDSHPELKQVVEQYKNEINESNNKKTRYIEIATVARIRDDYNKLNNQENNIVEENNKVNNEENTEQVEIKEEKEDLTKKKELLEKLNINMEFLGLDLSKVPTENLKDYRVYIIPALYVISSFISIKLTTNSQKKDKKQDGKEGNKEEPDAMAQMSKSMSYVMPIMTLSIAVIAPLGLALYWFVSNVLMILERIIINKIVDNREAE